MSPGPERHVLQVGYQPIGSEVILAAEIEDRHQVCRVSPAPRAQLARKAIGLVNRMLVKWSGMPLFTRILVGHDEVVDEGLLAGAPLRLKDRLVPLNITETGQWQELER